MKNQRLLSWFEKKFLLKVTSVFSKKNWVPPLFIVVQAGKHDLNLSGILLAYLQTRTVYFNFCCVINYWRGWLDSRGDGVWERGYESSNFLSIFVKIDLRIWSNVFKMNCFAIALCLFPITVSKSWKLFSEKTLLKSTF